MARREPGPEPLARQRHGIGRGDADDVEAERPGAGDERLLQKSRSA